MNHRLTAPPALPLERQRARPAGPIQQSRTVADVRPAARLAEIVNARPQKLSGIRRMIANGRPLPAVVGVFRANDFARRLLLVRSENFVLAIILPDHVQQIRQPVVVVMAHVRTKERLGRGPRGIVLADDFDEAFENSLGEFSLGCREFRCRHCKG